MSASINFSVIPSTLRVPGIIFEVDATQANVPQINQNSLIIGQPAGGTYTANVPVLVNGLGDAAILFGTNSMLTNMIGQYRQIDPVGTLYALPVADSGAGVAGVQTVTVGTTGSNADVTGSGTASFYFAGNQVPVAVTAGQTNNTIAANLVTAIQQTSGLPFTATAGAGGNAHIVTCTMVNKGVAAADDDQELNFLGALNNEITPTGLSVTFNTVTAGSGDPDVSGPLANCSTTNFDFICFPYTGTSNLNEFQTFVGDLSGRWSYTQQVYGGGFGAYKGTYSATATFGQSRNDQHMSILQCGGVPNPAYMVAASYTAASANSLRADPGLPLGGAGDGVTLPNIYAPQIQNQLDYSERNTLLYDGISTMFVEQSGMVRVERAITTFQLNGANQPDAAYLNVNVPFQIQFFLRGLGIDLATKFGRKKLVDNGQRIAFGQNTVTPQIIANEIVAFYNTMCGQGICQNPQTFAQNIQATIQSPGVVACLIPLDLAGQLMIIESLVQFTQN